MLCMDAPNTGRPAMQYRQLWANTCALVYQSDHVDMQRLRHNNDRVMYRSGLT